MGVQELVSALEAEGERRRRAVLEEADREASRILGSVREAEREARERLVSEAERGAADEARRLLHDAARRARGEVLAARRALVWRVREAAAAALRAAASDPSWGATLEALVREAVAAAGGEAGVVRVRREDVPRVASLGLPLAIEGDDRGPGVDVSSADGRVRLRGRLEDRLERAWPDLEVRLAEALP